MANMSYCRFENTSNDLSDCCDSMEEAANWQEMELSRREAEAAEDLYKLAQRYIQLVDNLNTSI